MQCVCTGAGVCVPRVVYVSVRSCWGLCPLRRGLTPAFTARFPVRAHQFVRYIGVRYSGEGSPTEKAIVAFPPSVTRGTVYSTAFDTQLHVFVDILDPHLQLTIATASLTASLRLALLPHASCPLRSRPPSSPFPCWGCRIHVRRAAISWPGLVLHLSSLLRLLCQLTECC